MCTDPPGVQWFTRICYLASRELMQAGTSIFGIKGVNAGKFGSHGLL